MLWIPKAIEFGALHNVLPVNWCILHMQNISMQFIGSHRLWYLKGAPGEGIVYACHWHLNIADWEGSKSDRQSTIGHCTFVGRNLVAWRNKKQVGKKYQARTNGSCDLDGWRFCYMSLALRRKRRATGPHRAN